MTTIDSAVEVPVRRSIRVRASAPRAFRVFTEQMDAWWPRTHHIGKSPMTKVVVEGHEGGRLYSEQQDGTECDWGKVIAWEPPQRFVMAWRVSPSWQFEPDLAKCSEVEVTFIPTGDGYTDVGLEHRRFERHGTGWEKMRESIGGDGGWNGVLQLFARQAHEPSESAD